MGRIRNYMQNDSVQKEHIKKSNHEAQYNQMQTKASRKALITFKRKPYYLAGEKT